MADTLTVFLVYRKEGSGIQNIFGGYENRDIANEVVDEIVDEQISRLEDPHKREKAEEQIRGKLEIHPLTVRTTAVY